MKRCIPTAFASSREKREATPSCKDRQTCCSKSYSDSSEEEKDLVVTLRQNAYWEAGVREYWLVDARGDRLSFDILSHGARGYAVRRKKDGWVKSEVFGKSFRLTRSKNALRHPEFSLEVR